MQAAAVQAVRAWLAVALVGGAAAFLATPVNMSDPDVSNILCPDELSGVNRDHEWLTREAVRRNIRDFFLNYPPPAQPDFWVEEDASLTQLFHAYYGPSASPARFIRAVNSIASANVHTDSATQYRYDPSIQADGEQVQETHARLEGRYSQMLSTIMVEEAFSPARELLGTSLHSLQKFYSHTSWVEQGNTDILQEFGLPGQTLPDIADPAEATCTSCADPQGCPGNVVVGSSLSSGYYFYPDEAGESYLVPKPSTGGKCSHGGVLDTSQFEAAVGGINKDTTSPCFSPHHHLHAQAAELAVMATDYYLRTIHNAIGYDKYRRLFDLYQGSALSICMDTTGSMGDDLDAVKAQVTQIVQNSNPEIYIFSPFNDPSCGPVFKTTNSTEFMEVVNDTYPYGGGDGPELFWCGLQNALGATPDYGDVFCFTDAGAKDGYLMDAVISLAKHQTNKVTVIMSDLLINRGQDGERQGQDGVRQEREEVITGVPEYQYLTEATGGLFINSEKFNIDDIADIMGSGVETTSATVVQLNVTGAVVTQVPVEETMFDIEVRLSGPLTSAVFTDSAGGSHDLMNEAGLDVTPGVEVVSFTDTFKAVRFTTLTVGLWQLSTDCTEAYLATVLSTSTLDFLANMALLDPSPPHPHYRPVEGSPLSDTVYYVEVTLIGHLESKVALADVVSFIDQTGATLQEVDYSVALAEQVYLRTDPLPTLPFYFQLTGSLSSGNKWQRVMPSQVVTVEATVELLSTSEELVGRPGEAVAARFQVYNFGLESYFDVTGTDDKGFLTGIQPSLIYLVHNSSAVVEARFQVPVDAVHGTLSTVVVTARSQKQTQSFNTAIAHFLVLSPLDDTKSPTCVITNMPDCSGYDNNGVCSIQPWRATATMQDSESGLYMVEAVPEGTDLTVTGLDPGTTHEVLVDYSSTCCTLHAEFHATDGWGNVGTCVVDMGVLGGMVYDFKVDNVTSTSMLMHWNLTASSLPVVHYNLQVTSDTTTFTDTSRCTEYFCKHLLAYLDPCTQYNFILTPVFDYLGDQLPGLDAYSQGVTLDNEPGTPTNGLEIEASETSITVAWEAFDAVCSFMFEVCHHHVELPASNATCATTSLTSYTIYDLEPCNAYFIHISALSPTGLQSDPLDMSAVTLCSSLPL